MSVGSLLSGEFPGGADVVIMGLSALSSASELADNLAMGAAGLPDFVSETVEVLSRPLLGAVPIKCDQYEMAREVDVSDTLVISQNDNQKGYVTDNAAPHPRVWTLHGYIDSLIPVVENGMAIRPTLLIQKSYLDNLAKSRAKFKFKTSDNDFVDVLMQSLRITESPKFANVFEVSVKLKEFVSISAGFDPAADISGNGAKGAGGFWGAFKSTFSKIASVKSIMVMATTGYALTMKATSIFRKSNGEAKWTTYLGNFFPIPLVNDYVINKDGNAESSSGGSGGGGSGGGGSGGGGSGGGDTDTIDVKEVIVSPKALKINVGMVYEMKVFVYPYNASNRQVMWVSDTEDVIKVIDGKVYALKKGTATIGATSDNGKSDGCSVEVLAAGTEGATYGGREEKVVKNILFNITSLKLKQNKKHGIKVTILPYDADDKRLTWVSSNASVVTVDSGGNIESLGQYGNAVIKAECSNGVKAELTVTVDNAGGIDGNGGNGEDGYETAPTASDSKSAGGYRDVVTDDTYKISFPAILPQDMDGSTVYVIPFTAVGDNEDNITYSADCGGVTYKVRLVWARRAQNEYKRLVNLLEVMRKQCNVYGGLSYNKVGNVYTAGYGGMVMIPADLRLWVNEMMDFVTLTNRITVRVVNLIQYMAQRQPVQEPTENIRAEWIGLMNDILIKFTTNLWGQKIIKEIEHEYLECVMLQDIFTSPPTEGIVEYLRTRMEMLPDFRVINEHIKKTYNPYITLYTDLDHYHSFMYWTATVSNDTSDRDMTFILRPSGRLFTGTRDYVVTVQAAQCGAYGNVMHNQLGYTALSIEVS